MVVARRARVSFAPEPEAVGVARHFVRAFLEDDERAEDAELIVSELATNALRHARSPFTVTVTLGSQLRIEVADASASLPTPRAAPPDAVDGRGLEIVEALACAWGTRLIAHGGKVVWAELEALPATLDAGAMKDWLGAFRVLRIAETPSLDVAEQLEGILEQVTALLDADTAAVLLLDERSRLLRARAAHGLQEAVLQGVTVPLGVGFAGRIASDRRPVLLDRVDATTVVNPILWEKGIASMLGVPLQSGTRLRGVLHVGRLSGRRFGENDVELLELVGRRMGDAFSE